MNKDMEVKERINLIGKKIEILTAENTMEEKYGVFEIPNLFYEKDKINFSKKNLL